MVGLRMLVASGGGRCAVHTPRTETHWRRLADVGQPTRPKLLNLYLRSNAKGKGVSKHVKSLFSHNG